MVNVNQVGSKVKFTGVNACGRNQPVRYGQFATLLWIKGTRVYLQFEDGYKRGAHITEVA